MTGPTVLRTWPGRAALVATLAVTGGALTLLPGGSPAASAAGLEPWSGCDALLEHYRAELSRSATPWGVGYGGGVFAAEDAARSSGGAGTMALAESAAPAAAGADLSTGGAVGSGPTGTNLQEQGVDEPDTAKTSGDLLLAVARGSLQVVRAGRSPELLATVPLGRDGQSGGGEVLVDGDRALVLVPGWKPAPGAPAPEPLPEPVPVEPVPVEPLPEPVPVEPVPVDPVPVDPVPVDPGIGGEVPPVTEPDGAVPPVAPVPADPDAPTSSSVLPSVARTSMVGPSPGESVLRLVLVDLADPRAPRVLETLELEGRYVSARLVDGTVRVVTSSAPSVPGVTPVEPFGPAQERAALEDNRRRAAGVTVEQVLPQAVRRDAAGQELDAGATLGCADVRHASTAPTGTTTLAVTTLRPAAGLAAVDSTAVTTDGDLVYASAERLYVATSRWGTVGPAVTSARTAAPEEVTTELHAFDTSSAQESRYVGSGSVPGYVYGRWALSSHEGHLRVATTSAPPWEGAERSSSSVFVLAEREDGLQQIGRLDGLGVDERIYAVRYLGDLATVVTFRQTDPLYVLDLGDPASPRLLGELKVPGFSTYLHPIGEDRLLGLGQEADAEGRVTGMQVSVFDLSDLSRPTQVDRLQLGEGWSPALEDSRAFSYDPARRLAVLPLSSYEPTGAGSQALGVRVTDDFRLQEAGRLSIGMASGVERVLLGRDAVLAVTPEGVTAADADDLARTGSAAFR